MVSFFIFFQKVVRVRKQVTRNNTVSKPKAVQRNEKYLKYKKYLKTKQFKEVKQIAEERDGHKCMVCGRTREDGIHLTCHHRIYNHLYCGGEIEAADCITLCSICHSAIHSSKKNYTWFSQNNERNNTEEKLDNGTDFT